MLGQLSVNAVSRCWHFPDRPPPLPRLGVTTLDPSSRSLRCRNQIFWISKKSSQKHDQSTQPTNLSRQNPKPPDRKDHTRNEWRRPLGSNVYSWLLFDFSQHLPLRKTQGITDKLGFDHFRKGDLSSIFHHSSCESEFRRNIRRSESRGCRFEMSAWVSRCALIRKFEKTEKLTDTHRRLRTRILGQVDLGQGKLEKINK